MSEPAEKGDSKKITDRFRYLLETDESKNEATQERDGLRLEKDDSQAINGKGEIGKREKSSQFSEEFNNSPVSDGDVPPSMNPKQVDIESLGGKHKLPVANQSNETIKTDVRYSEPPAIDEYGMPIPRRKEEISISPTANISNLSQPSSALISSSREIPGIQPGSQTFHPRIAGKAAGRNKKKRSTFTIRQGMGCLLRMALLTLLAGILLFLIGGSFALYEYYKIAATLPSVADLQQRASTFETTRILDRNGGLLYEILDPNAGRRTFTTLDKISPYLVAATLATEDKSFYSHPGFDWTAIVRAFWQNFQGGGTVSGASTITQQLARNLLLSPEERNERSYLRKVREALLAAEITRRYTKDQILELYLNEFYYGNLAYGIQAASQTYFDETADNLDLAQASFLAGLPQAPSVYDVYNNREAARNRQKQVLTLMYEASNEQGCIFVSNSAERICVDALAAVNAYTALENYQFNPPDVLIHYPHWVNYVRSILESQFDAQTIYHSGFSVYTTIDPDLQDKAELIVKDQINSLTAYNANDAALVAIRPSTGEILAMVGSADFYNDEIDGQVNMATSPTRQPGSSIKPITYVAAFEKGWTPATLIWDVPSEFPPSGDPNDQRPPYTPVNYDGRFHGPVTVRSALANSYNIPAVKTLDFVGIYDNPNTPELDGMIAEARKLGISSLTRPDYGLSLTLGGGEVSLLEMTGAYSVFANGGSRVPPFAISRILDHNNELVYESQAATGEQVIRPEHAFLISSILSDNEARSPMFGAGSVLALPFVAAAKTGTSNDYRDNWTLGYTPELAVGVWVGNADYSAMQDITGVTGAAPIWADFMEYAVLKITDGNPAGFIKPSGVVDRVICSVSGTEPSQWCPSQRSEFFAADQLPLTSSNDLWSKITFDTWTGLRASEACSVFTKEEFAVNVVDSWAIGWIQNNPEGMAWAEEMGFKEPIRFAPPRACDVNDPHPIIDITSPINGQTITTSPLDIMGKIDVSADFSDYKIEYGIGNDPAEWRELTTVNQPFSQPGKIYSWDLYSIPPGEVTIKITMHSVHGGYAERFIHINLQVATPTPTITPTMIPTATPTSTLIPTTTPVPTQTQIITPNITPTDTPQPIVIRP